MPNDYEFKPADCEMLTMMKVMMMIMIVTMMMMMMMMIMMINLIILPKKLALLQIVDTTELTVNLSMVRSELKVNFGHRRVSSKILIKR